ncbi:hypothetical protein TNCV_4369651 [Trichonephila clavipes]|nr:hypothetical protein TNCV_4369651 [Trichonephila clavipes]
MSILMLTAEQRVATPESPSFWVHQDRHASLCCSVKGSCSNCRCDAFRYEFVYHDTTRKTGICLKRQRVATSASPSYKVHQIFTGFYAIVLRKAAIIVNVVPSDSSMHSDPNMSIMMLHAEQRIATPVSPFCLMHQCCHVSSCCSVKGSCSYCHCDALIYEYVFHETARKTEICLKSQCVATLVPLSC